jgi:hypothetical protein
LATIQIIAGNRTQPSLLYNMTERVTPADPGAAAISSWWSVKKDTGAVTNHAAQALARWTHTEET